MASPAAILLLAVLSALVLSSTAAVNPNEAGCRALAESIGPQSLPQCHVWLPPSQFGYNTNVSIEILMKTVYGLDEKELLEFSAWIVISWIDPRLSWNSSAPGSPQQLRIDRNSLWLPDVGFLNSKGEMFDLRNTKFFDVVIQPLGSVMVFTYAVVQFACSVNVKYFPFDRQLCEIQLSTSSSDVTVFNLSVTVKFYNSLGNGLQLYQVGEWELEKVTYKVSESNMAGLGTFPIANIKFHLKRRWMYYAVLVIFPFELLSLLASIMFLAGDKSDPVNLSIAIIMSMTLYVLIASQSAPKSMNTIPLVGVFLMTQMLILIAFTFISALKLEKSTIATLVVPSKIKRIVGFLVNHKKSVCFLSYIGLSIVNLFVFMFVWLGSD